MNKWVLQWLLTQKIESANQFQILTGAFFILVHFVLILLEKAWISPLPSYE